MDSYKALEAEPVDCVSEKASGQFMGVLDKYTLADIVGNSRGQLKHLDINIVAEPISDSE